MWLSKAAMEGTIPAVAREVADVTGAGDTVVATLALALAAGATLAEAAALANHAAGIVVGKFGPGDGHRQRARRFIRMFIRNEISAFTNRTRTSLRSSAWVSAWAKSVRPNTTTPNAKSSSSDGIESPCGWVTQELAA